MKTSFLKGSITVQGKLWLAFLICVLVSSAIVPAALYCSSLLVIPVSALCIAFYTRIYLFTAFLNINSAEVRKTMAFKTLFCMISQLVFILSIPTLITFILFYTRFSDVLFSPCSPQFFRLDHVSTERHFIFMGSVSALDVNGWKAVLIAASHQSMLVSVTTHIVAWTPLLSVCDSLFSSRAISFDPRFCGQKIPDESMM